MAQNPDFKVDLNEFAIMTEEEEREHKGLINMNFRTYSKNYSDPQKIILGITIPSAVTRNIN